MKLILTLEQELDRKVYRTTVIKDQPAVTLDELMPIFREAALAAGFHPDTVNDYMPQSE